MDVSQHLSQQGHVCTRGKLTTCRSDYAFHIQPSVLSAVHVSRFGEDSQERMVDWLDDNEDLSKDEAILDLGCGNGALLLELVSGCGDMHYHK